MHAAVCCLMHVVCCMLPVARCLLLFHEVWRMLPVARCTLFVKCCMSSTAWRMLPAVFCCTLRVVCCIFPVARCMWRGVCCTFSSGAVHVVPCVSLTVGLCLLHVVCGLFPFACPSVPCRMLCAVCCLSLSVSNLRQGHRVKERAPPRCAAYATALSCLVACCQMHAVCCLFRVVYTKQGFCCMLHVARCPVHVVCCVACRCCSLHDEMQHTTRALAHKHRNIVNAFDGVRKAPVHSTAAADARSVPPRSSDVSCVILPRLGASDAILIPFPASTAAPRLAPPKPHHPLQPRVQPPSPQHVSHRHICR